MDDAQTQPKRHYHRVSVAQRTKILDDSRTSALRLLDYVKGNVEAYMSEPMQIYGSPHSIRVMNHDLLRHDIHVLFHTRNALVGYVPPITDEDKRNG